MPLQMDDVSLNSLKPRLVILSDLWGKEKGEWLTFYTSALENHFEIIYYDCCDLGNVDKTDYSEQRLHTQFINGGVDKAVHNLLLLEKATHTILAFSIGGYVAWKASLAGLKAQSIFAVSSTRLRTENEKPGAIIKLFYGENDSYKPEDHWFQDLELEYCILNNEGHDLYRSERNAALICAKIIGLVSSVA
jgi:hypothetical protein